MRTALAVGLVVSLSASSAFAQHEGMPRTAFVFESRFGGAFNLAGIPGSTIVPGLMVGARLIDRIHIGLDFFITNVTGIGPGSAATTVFTLGPLVTVDILKAAANRVAFYGKVDLGFGDAAFTGGAGPRNDNFVFRFDLGLGVRFAPVHYFAIGMESGVLGLTENPGASGFLATGLYGSIVGTFFYSKH